MFEPTECRTGLQVADVLLNNPKEVCPDEIRKKVTRWEQGVEEKAIWCKSDVVLL